MSAMSPFREDFELTESMEALWPASDAAFEEDEAWYPRQRDPVAEAVDEEDFDFAEAEEETAHPILALFPLPAAVLEALAAGLSSAAVGLAAAAGYRDVNQLTNIVFYFRHPDMIGQKIKPEERDLAAEWISIRDRIVKPALASGSSSAGPFAPAAPATGPTDAVPDSLSSSRLVWPGAKSAEEMAFMRAVYDRHAERSKERGAGFVMDLPESAVGPIERGHVARKDTAQAVRALLAEARKALEAEHPNARIGITSAYRPATRQFEIWQGRNFDGTDRGGGFPHYYRKAIREGAIREGDFSAGAVEKMVDVQGKCIASPGYSNHQDGLAIDFGVAPVGKGLKKIGSGSWFHRWLQTNAKRFHFRPLATEAWHWTYHPPVGSSEIWESEVAPATVRANRVEMRRVPLLARHRGNPPDLVLRWNDMPAVPEEIDVVVHLHGFWYSGLKLPRDIEPVSGLELTPASGTGGPGRARPTLTVLPRAHNTGVKQTNGPYYAYTFPAIVTPSGFSDLLRFSLDRFAAEVGGAAPRIGRLILTAHSGGGKALLQILGHQDPHQVHVHDALYWSPGALADWARKRIRRDRAALQGGAPIREYMSTQGGALRVFYQDRTKRGTRPKSLELRDVIAAELGDGLENWYRVEASKYDHFQIPRSYGRRVLADASADVPDAYVEQAVHRRDLEDAFVDAEYEDTFGEDELDELDEAPLNDLPEPVSRARRDDWVAPEPESERELWVEGEGDDEQAEDDLEFSFAIPGTVGEEEEEEEDEQAFLDLEDEGVGSLDLEETALEALVDPEEAETLVAEDEGEPGWETELWSPTTEEEEESEDVDEVAVPAFEAPSVLAVAGSAGIRGVGQLLREEEAEAEAEDVFEETGFEGETPPRDVVDPFLESRRNRYRVELVGTNVHVTVPRSDEWTAQYTNRALSEGALGAAIGKIYTGTVSAANVRKAYDKLVGHGIKYTPAKKQKHTKDAVHLLIVDERAMTTIAEALNYVPREMREEWRKKFGEAKMIEFALGSAYKSFDALKPHFSAKDLAAGRMTVELIYLLLDKHTQSMIEVAKRHRAAKPWRDAFGRNLALFWAEREPTIDDFDKAPLSQWAKTVLELATATRTTVNKQLQRQREEERKHALNEHLRPHEIKVDNAATFILETFEPTHKVRLDPHAWIVHGGQRLTNVKNEPIYLLRVSSTEVIYQHLGNGKFYKQSLEGFTQELLYGIYALAGEKASGVIPITKWVIGVLGAVFPIVRYTVMATDILNAAFKLKRNQAELERHYAGMKLAYANIESLLPGALPKIWDAVLDKRNASLFNPLENPDLGAWLKAVIRVVMMRQTRIVNASYAADAVNGFFQKAWAAIKKGLDPLAEVVKHVIVVAPAVAGSTGVSGNRALAVAEKRLKDIGVDAALIVDQVRRLSDDDKKRLARELQDLVDSGTKLINLLKESFEW